VEKTLPFTKGYNLDGFNQATNIKSTAFNQIKEIKALGGDVVRLPLKFYDHMNRKKTVTLQMFNAFDQ
jgi:hypothetical protein